MNDPMEIDGLTAGSARPGQKGIAGGLLERLEREALEEQRVLEEKAAGGAAGSSSSAGGGAGRPKRGAPAEGSSPGALDGLHGTEAVGGTYVPGANKKPRTDSPAAAGVPPTSPALGGPSTKPRSSSSATATAPGGKGKEKEKEKETEKDKEKEKEKENDDATSDNAAATTAAPAKKAPRIQPTIRMVFTFPKYPTNREPTAKQVPVFDIHQTALTAGLLLPPEEKAEEDDASSSEGGSDDEGEENDKGDESNAGEETGAEKETPIAEVGMSDSQRAIRAALDLAKRGKKPIMVRKRVRDRDEGYDVTDAFVDDSELLINEPKYQPRPKIEGYCAVVGPVEVVDDDEGKPKKGRKFGSVNKPKVTVVQPDGTTKLVSEAVAAREAKRVAKTKEGPNEGGSSVTAKQEDPSASASPAPQASTSAGDNHNNKPESRSSSANLASSSNNANAKGPLMSKDAVMYSHLPSSTHAFSASAPAPGTAAAATPPPSHSRANSYSNGAATSTPGVGSRMSPINVDDEDTLMSGVEGETPAPTAKPAHVFSFNPSPEKGGKKYEYASVSTDLEAALGKLRKAVSKESFVPKNKFPPALKPILQDVCLLALDKGEYDDNFFNIMPNIFPYNRFTMTKMIKKDVCEPRCKILEDDIAKSVVELKAEVNKTFPKLREEYEQKLKEWEVEMSEYRKTKGHDGNAAAAQQRAHSLTPVGSDGDISTNAPNGADADGPEKPKPKFKFSDTARMILWQIMTNSNEITERRTEKAEFEGVEGPSHMNATKARYSELTKIWPEGWMQTNQLSREMTAAKKKLEKQMASGGR